jgi:histidinol-phosphate aminotransferase
MASDAPSGERPTHELHPGRLAVPAVRELSPYLPGKPISELQRELGIQDIIKLASNENPYGPSPHALAAMRAAIEDVWLYPDGGCHDLKQGLARHLGVDPACLTLGNGSNDLLVLLAEAFLTPSHSAVYSQYGFAIYALVTRETGAQPIEVPALGAGSDMPLGHDLAAMAAAITPNTRLLFIANPNNPTGTWAPPAVLKGLLERTAPTTLVVLDEAYFEYGHAQGTQDGVAWLAEHPNLVILRTFSKAYGLAGARVGYSISHPEVAEVLNRLRPAFNVNSIAQAGALAALGDQTHMRTAVSSTMRELIRVEAVLKEMRLWTAPSAANFLLLRLATPAAPVFERLLRCGLIVRPLAGYGLKECLRISIGLPRDNDRLLATLPKVL